MGITFSMTLNFIEISSRSDEKIGNKAFLWPFVTENPNKLCHFPMDIPLLCRSSQLTHPVIGRTSSVRFNQSHESGQMNTKIYVEGYPKDAKNEKEILIGARIKGKTNDCHIRD